MAAGRMRAIEREKNPGLLVSSIVGSFRRFVTCEKSL